MWQPIRLVSDQVADLGLHDSRPCGWKQDPEDGLLFFFHTANNQISTLRIATESEPRFVCFGDPNATVSSVEVLHPLQNDDRIFSTYIDPHNIPTAKEVLLRRLRFPNWMLAISSISGDAILVTGYGDPILHLSGRTTGWEERS